MAGAKWVALALAGVLTAGIAGCGGGENNPDVRRIAIAAPGKVGDIGWNQQGITAAAKVARQLGIHEQVVDGLGDGDVTSQLDRLAKDDVQLLIAHGRDYAPAAVSVARRTEVPTLVFGSRERLQDGLVGDVEVASEEGGYLAGYIASRASYVVAVGIVVTSDDPYWYRTAGGFIAGARKFDPDTRIVYERVGPEQDDDVDAARRAAERVIARGAQMVLGLGERSTFGVMAATRNALEGIDQPKFDSMFVDVIGDKSGAGHRSITGLTAVIWNFAPAYKQAIRDLRAGRFGRHPYTLDLANRGVSVIADGRTPSDGYEAALKLGEQISQGKITVPVTSTDAEVRALLAQRG